jgi:NADPH-dependent ferric siderophore reductase
MPEIGPGASLTPITGSTGRWLLEDRSGVPVAEYAWDELRFSVSWKAYCFVNDAERDAWREHTDDLTLEVIVDRFCADLAERGVSTERDGDLGLRMIDEYIRFPAAA